MEENNVFKVAWCLIKEFWWAWAMLGALVVLRLSLKWYDRKRLLTERKGKL